MKGKYNDVRRHNIQLLYMYTVHCTMYIMYNVYSVYCIMYTINCTYSIFNLVLLCIYFSVENDY